MERLSRQDGKQESWLKERSRCTRWESKETDAGKVVRRPGRGSPLESCKQCPLVRKKNAIRAKEKDRESQKNYHSMTQYCIV